MAAQKGNACRQKGRNINAAVHDNKISFSQLCPIKLLKKKKPPQEMFIILCDAHFLETFSPWALEQKPWYDFDLLVFYGFYF